MIRKSKQRLSSINAGSMADIAFLLLIFFLVTTTMETDSGILRLLPPPIDDSIDETIVNQRNVYVVWVSSSDELNVEGQRMDIGELREGTREFFTNPKNLIDLPERILITREEVNNNILTYKELIKSDSQQIVYKKKLAKWEKRLNALNLIGEYYELPGSVVISLRNDTETSYDMYIQIQNELTGAINELRNELSLEKFGKRYAELNQKNPEEKKMILAIRQIYPQRISEAEPNETHKNK